MQRVGLLIQNVIGMNGYNPINAVRVKANAQPDRTNPNDHSGNPLDSPAA